jgi:hypothetical protein
MPPPPTWHRALPFGVKIERQATAATAPSALTPYVRIVELSHHQTGA